MNQTRRLPQAPLLIVVAAPSGAGKTTLCEKLLRDFGDKLTLSISATTRAPRGQEKHGVDYFFLTPEEFQAKIQAREFAEHALVHGKYYGTLKSTVESAFARGKSVLLDIDVQGAESFRREFPDKTLSFFIAPPDLTALEKRLRARGTDSEESIQKRLANARREMEQSNRFDHVIVNDELARAYGELRRHVEPFLGTHGKG